MHRHDLFPANALTHPAFLFSAALLFFNDHVLKGAGVLPGWVTGKLSDFAGLMVAPVILAWCLRVRSRRAFAAAHVAVGAVFSALEVSPSLATAVATSIDPWMTTRIVADLGDLIALPALLVSFFLFGGAHDTRAGTGARRSVVAERLVGMAALVACCATSRPPPGKLASDPRTVYAQKFHSGALVALDGKNGTIRRVVDAHTVADPPTVFEGVVYLGGASLRAIDLGTGNVIYDAPQAKGIGAILAVDARFVYTRSWGQTNTYAVFDRANGALVAESPIPGGFASAWKLATVSPGRVAILEGDVVTVRDPVRVVRRFALPGDATARDFAVDETRIVIATNDGALVGYELSTGTQIFVRTNAGYVGSYRRAIALSGEALVYSAEEGLVLARASDGRRVRTLPGVSTFAIDADGIYGHVPETSRLVAYDRAGEVRWSSMNEIGWLVDMALTRDSVVLRDGNDNLLGFDRATGRQAFSFSFDGVPDPE